MLAFLNNHSKSIFLSNVVVQDIHTGRIKKPKEFIKNFEPFEADFLSINIQEFEIESLKISAYLHTGKIDTGSSTID